MSKLLELLEIRIKTNCALVVLFDYSLSDMNVQLEGEQNSSTETVCKVSGDMC